MAWLDDLVDFAVKGLQGAVQVGRAIAGAVGELVQKVTESARRIADEAVRRADKAFRDEPETVREAIERDLQEVNERLQRLRQKYRERGSLSDDDDRLRIYLRERRDQLNKRLSGLEQILTAEEIVQRQQDYQSITITTETAHVLQYHVGQNTYNKTCVCGRPMVLQWPRDRASISIRDLFWGCSGWYVENNGEKSCKRTRALSAHDLTLFANLNRPEFKWQPADLAGWTRDPARERRVRDALESIRAQQRRRRIGVAVYRCPIHGESLRLQRKRERNGELLDEFFLGCPRWLPANQGCNFMVKLKSPAQISAVLTAGHGKGLFETAA